MQNICGLQMQTFGRQSADDVLRVLREKAAAFEQDPLNAELANQCAIDAWSLCDWVFKEHGNRLGIQKLRQLQARMTQQCPELAFFQDVANASKHGGISKYAPQLKEAKYHQGGFAREAFSSGFDVSALVLVGNDGSEIWFDHALNKVVDHWVQFFDQNQLQINS